MAKVKSLQSSEESIAKKEAQDLRYKFAKTDKQKKFLDENPNVKTASEMDKKIKSMKSSNIQTRMSPSGYEMAKGGRAGYKGGKSVKKKRGAAIRGVSKILR